MDTHQGQAPPAGWIPPSVRATSNAGAILRALHDGGSSYFDLSHSAGSASACVTKNIIVKAWATSLIGINTWYYSVSQSWTYCHGGIQSYGARQADAHATLFGWSLSNETPNQGSFTPGQSTWSENNVAVFTVTGPIIGLPIVTDVVHIDLIVNGTGGWYSHVWAVVT